MWVRTASASNPQKSTEISAKRGTTFSRPRPVAPNHINGLRAAPMRQLSKISQRRRRYGGRRGYAHRVDRRRHKAKIPVLTFDSDSPKSHRLLFVGTNNYNAGYQAGLAVAKLPGDKARVASRASTRSITASRASPTP
jgi:hypothetical protein